MRRAIAALVAVALLEVLSAAAWLTQEEKPPPALVLLPGAGQAGAPDSAELRQVARMFRPYLFFDRGEPWRPVEVGRFLAELYPDGRGHEVCARSDQRSCPRVGSIDELVATIAARDPDQALRLNIHGRQGNGRDYASPTRATCFEERLRDCDSGPASVIYANVHPAGDELFIDYWWFLRYNDFPRPEASQCGLLRRAFGELCGDHEGDWEGITVVTDLPATRVTAAVFAQHRGRLRLVPGPRGSLRQGRFEFADPARRHPKVYVAQGSHAAYPSECGHERRICFQTNRLPEGFHDGSRPWGRNDDGECGDDPGCVLLLPRVPTDNPGEPLLYAASWNAWPGLWGFCARTESGCGLGPEAPGLQGRYQRPTNRLTPLLEISDSAVPLPAPAGGE